MQKKKKNIQSIKQAFLQFQRELKDLRREQRQVVINFIHNLEQEKMEDLRKKLKG